MPSRLESILAALRDAIEAGTAAEVLRNEVADLDVGASGLVILRDGDPGEPEITMSPLRYHYEHRALAEVFAPGGAARDAAFDALKLALGGVLAADRTLGGLCDWIEAEAPDTSDLDMDGGATIKAGTVPLVIHFSTPDPLA